MAELAPKPEHEEPSPLDRTLAGRIVIGLAKGVALLGGASLIVSIVVVVWSVVGRSLIWAGLSPVRGDYEIVTMLVAFALFSFLPWAHLTRSHASVEIFTDRLGRRANQAIQIVSDALMLLLALFIAWRHTLGTMDKFDYGETTLLLRTPLGWPYSACLLGLYAFVIVAVYVLIRTLNDVFSSSSAAQGSAAS